jgi:hypothetical protein
MKKAALFSTLTALLFVSGCSTPTVPSTPKQKSGKYALQIIRIEAPVGEDTIQSLPEEHDALLQQPTTTYRAARSIPAFGSTNSFISPDIETLLNNPNAAITEFPIVYAGIGETGINDQTKTHSFPTTYELQTDSNRVVNVVYDNHKDIKIGQYVEMTLQKVENNTATCALQFYEKSLQGMQTYEVAPSTETQEAITASMPVFKQNGMNTKVNLALGSWISMGGLIREQTKDLSSGKIKKTQTFINTWIRILPPKGVPFQSTQPTPKVYHFPVSELEKTTP